MADWFRSLVNNKKITYAALSAVVFMAVSLPQTYQQTERLPYVHSIEGNCPTAAGKFLHTGIFFVILYFLMKWLNKSDLSDGLIAKYSFYSALLFFLLTSSDTYALTSGVPGLNDLVDASGCPSKKGVLVHGLVYLVVLTLIMYFPKDQ
jgi:hypothetical protein